MKEFPQRVMFFLVIRLRLLQFLCLVSLFFVSKVAPLINRGEKRRNLVIPTQKYITSSLPSPHYKSQKMMGVWESSYSLGQGMKPGRNQFEYGVEETRQLVLEVAEHEDFEEDISLKWRDFMWSFPGIITCFCASCSLRLDKICLICVFSPFAFLPV